MTTTTAEPKIVDKGRAAVPITYNVTDGQIADIRNRLSNVSFATKDGYETGRAGIAECRTLRTAVEKRRKELKADALEYGRQVDEVAKHLTQELEKIEEPLKAAKKLVDDEADRIKREKAEAEERARREEYARQQAEEEARLRSIREAEEARIAADRAAVEAERAEQEAKRKKFEEEWAAEEARLKAEREKLEQDRLQAVREEEARQADARAEQDRLAAIEREKLAAERRELEAAKAQAAAEEAARQQRIRQEQEERERAEREALEAEARAREEAEREAREYALRPDIEKLRSFAKMLREIEGPELVDAEAQCQLEFAKTSLQTIANQLDNFRA